MNSSTEPKIGEHFKVIPAANGIGEITVLANGLNFYEDGVWHESQPNVLNFSSGIVCTGASYQVILATNLNSFGSVDLELPTDSKTGMRGRMVSHPLGLAFYDPDSGDSVLLAALQDCSAQVVSNQIIFANVFSGSNGIEGSITYTYGIGHFHQDVTLTAQPSVTPADFGMGVNARLEMLTEIVQSPEPVITEKTLRAGTGSTATATKQQSGAEPVLTDQTLDFGTMQMVRGKAFSTASAQKVSTSPGELKVTKQLVRIDNRTVLTEDVPWSKAVEALRTLPLSAAAKSIRQSSLRSSSENERLDHMSRALPRDKMIAQLKVSPPSRESGKQARMESGTGFSDRLAGIQRTKPLELAALNSQPSTINSINGFVMDYELVQSTPYFTFQTGHTYLINSYVSIIYATFESGSVTKFAGGQLAVLYYLTCPGSGPKAVLTDVNDDSVGEMVPSSAHYFTGYHGAGLDLSQLGSPAYVGNMDIRFVSQGIYGPENEDVWCYIYDCWFFKCNTGVFAGIPSVYVYSADFCQVTTPMSEYVAFNYYYDTYCAVDRNGNTIPDSWEMDHFAALRGPDDVDYDGDGLSDLQEYNGGVNGTDPNTIAFSISSTNNYVGTVATALQVEITGGVPYSKAILVDTTNFATAQWTNYTSSSVNVNLGTAEGWHEVWIGLRGRLTTSQQTWRWKRLKEDRTAPTIMIVAPANPTVTQPMIQLRGYSPEALSSLSCNLSNAFGVFSNKTILVMDQYHDTNTFEFTTNTFQGFDLALADGVNTVTIRATDLAGNLTTTNFNFTLTNDMVAPVVELWWPLTGAQLCSDTFTWRGQVDDFTAKLTAAVVDNSGNTNTSTGLVERDGKFWFEDLPLASGASSLTLTAEDHWGNVTTTNINISRSTVNLTIDLVDESVLHEQTIPVEGTINVSDHSVWVNGMKATLTGNNWRAEKVPMTPGGTAVIQARAIPNSDNGGNGTGGSGGAGSTMKAMGNPTSAQQKDAGAQPDKGWQLYRFKDEVVQEKQSNDYLANYYLAQLSWWWRGKSTNTYSHRWIWDFEANAPPSGSGKSDWSGHNEGTYYDPPQDFGCPVSFVWPVPLVSPNYAYATTCNGTYNWISAPQIANEHCVVKNPPPTDTSNWYDYGNGATAYSELHQKYTRTAQTTFKLFTGGKKDPRRKALWRVRTAAREVLNQWATRPFDENVPNREIEKSKIKAMGKTLAGDGIIFKTLVNGEYVEVAVEVEGCDFYIFDTPTVEPYYLVSRCVCPREDLDRTTVGVGEQVNLKWSSTPVGGDSIAPPYPNEAITWSKSAGTVSPINTWSTLFTGPDHKENAVVTATVRGEECSVTFEVVEPVGVDHADMVSTLFGYTSGRAGAKMHIRPYLKPTKVSFDAVEIMEVGQDASNPTGYFAQWTPQQLAHNSAAGANAWIPIMCDNSWHPNWDKAGSVEFNPPWLGGGGYNWNIPWKWKIGSGQVHEMGNGWTQGFSMEANGTFTVEKFDRKVVRPTNQTFGTGY